MNKWMTISSIATPLDRANVDTDAIIPKQFLKSIKRSGFGVNLFDQWRYLDSGKMGMDHSKRPKNHDFVLNHPQYQNSSILLTRENFGCGSSREHATWALSDYGFRAIIAPSFAEIFYNNCFKNSILPIVLPPDVVSTLFVYEGNIRIDLENQSVLTQHKQYDFKVDSEQKYRLLGGLDDIGITLENTDIIRGFEKQYYQRYSWLS